MTRIVETVRSSYSSRTRSVKGVSGSFSTSAFISGSRIIKLVALRSSSMSSSEAPCDTASTTLAACEVEPDAWSVEKSRTSPPGSQRTKGEMSRFRTLRPSSAAMVTALSSVSTSSRPSPAMWSWMPAAIASSSVLLPE